MNKCLYLLQNNDNKITIHLDNIVAIISQETINLLCQGHSKCLQFPQMSVVIFDDLPHASERDD